VLAGRWIPRNPKFPNGPPLVRAPPAPLAITREKARPGDCEAKKRRLRKSAEARKRESAKAKKGDCEAKKGETGVKEMTRFEPTTQSRTSDETTRAISVERSAKRSRRRPRRGKAQSPNAYLASGATLGSARDRQRLRDRNAAERVRVEEMLANAPCTAPPPGFPAAPPLGLVRLTTPPVSTPSFSASFPASFPVSFLTPSPRRSVFGRGCPVCASSKVVSDEVSCGGTMRLSECLHCDHRWTDRPRGRWAELGARMSRRDRLAEVTRTRRNAARRDGSISR
jgi:hypothetical protein